MTRRIEALWDAFRHGDEQTVLGLLEAFDWMRHIGGEEPLRAACWFGMERVARYLVERCAAPIGPEMVELARLAGHAGIVDWLEQEIRALHTLIA